MNCRACQADIEEGVDGRMLAAPVRDHLMLCPDCRAAYKDARALRRLVSGLDRAPAPADFGFRVKAGIAQARRESAGHMRYLAFNPGWVSLAVSLTFCAVAAGIFFLRPKSAEQAAVTIAQNRTQEMGLTTPVAAGPDVPRSQIAPKRAVADRASTAAAPSIRHWREPERGAAGASPSGSSGPLARINPVAASEKAPAEKKIRVIDYSLRAGREIRLNVGPANEPRLLMLLDSSEPNAEPAAAFLLKDGSSILAFMARPGVMRDATPVSPRHDLNDAPVVLPALALVASDGKVEPVSFTGTDSETGLSLLRVNSRPAPPQAYAAESHLRPGGRIRLIMPRWNRDGPKPPSANVPTGQRTAEATGELTAVERDTSGAILRLTATTHGRPVQCTRGLALTATGEVIGLAENSSTGEIRITPTSALERAAARVLAQQAPPPRK